jgi:hypothetical protein
MALKVVVPFRRVGLYKHGSAFSFAENIFLVSRFRNSVMVIKGITKCILTWNVW